MISLDWIIEHVISGFISLLVDAITGRISEFLNGLVELLTNPPVFGA
jgi:hypothetical protein